MYIKNIHCVTPSYRAHRDQVIEQFSRSGNLNENERKKLNILFRASGIQYRHSILPDFNTTNRDLFQEENNIWNNPSTEERLAQYKEKASHLALLAARNSLFQSEYEPEDITHIIYVSCTGMYSPGVEIDLIKGLNLSSQTERHTVNFMGCHASFQALKIASALLSESPSSIILLVSLELCTLHYRRHHTDDQLLANALFSDGAAAAIIDKKVTSNSLEFKRRGSTICSAGKDSMTWEIGDHGFQMTLKTSVPDYLRDYLLPFITSAEIELKHIDQLAIHPGGKKILTTVEQSLGFSKADNIHSHNVLANYGNMSSATIWFVWQALMQDSSATSSVLSLAFGPGLSIEYNQMIYHP